MATPHRIVVIGTSCSGKSTLAARIAKHLGIKRVELDSLHWGPRWTEATPATFRERLREALQVPDWVVDGNYSRYRDELWRQAETIIWLDYPFLLVLWRALTRTLKRSIFRQELWAGNRESLSRAFFSRESILLWVLKTYARRKRAYPALIADPRYAHVKFVHCRTQADVEQFLDRLPLRGGLTPPLHISKHAY
jgi:adenylate kinase family enzyme